MNSFLLHCRSTAGSTGQIFTNLRVAACRILLRITRWLIFAAACLTTASPAAADGPPIVRVEEDWRIEVGTPAPEDHAPQIVTVLSPVGNLEREHSVFELNHATYPNYSAGGMQLQRWYRNWISGYSSTPQQQKLYYANEVVTFTSSMTIDDGHIEFRIENGESKSWSTFGGNGYLKTQSSTGLQDLNAYSPNVSVANSRVAFASHRVRKLVLTKIRYYSQEGIVTTDDTPRIVHEYSPE
ncbi:MAG: hypothetical protein ISQ06_11950 [Planctomycetaceae bacterium]|jgi:hypothetical protein|nr:hypothetical protein [Planctomycetaceae bacterium]